MNRLSETRGFTLIELLIVVAIIGIIAAIAIPSLLRARVTANEAAAIGDTRTVISAEAAFHSTFGGNYGDLTCLSTPTGCGSGTYPATAPTFLDPALGLGGAKGGYARSMIGNPSNGPGLFSCYVYNATPSVQNQTGVRGFGGDCTGRVCTSADGAAIGQTNAMMDVACTALQ